MTIEHALLTRADHKCELCESTTLLSQYEVASELPRESAVVLCEVCTGQLANDAELDLNHWHCLQGAIWSAHPAVQVLSWRMLQRLKAQPWALDLLEQVYLDDETKAWAKEGLAEEAADTPITLDTHGQRLFDGDAVTLVRNLDVKGTSFIAKQGTRVKDIRLIPNDPHNIEGKVNGVMLVLKTEFLKKA